MEKEGDVYWQRGLSILVTISNRNVKALLPKKISGTLILEDGIKSLGHSITHLALQHHIQASETQN